MPRRPRPPPAPLCGCGLPKSRRHRGEGSVSLRRDGRHQAQAARAESGGARAAAYFPGDPDGHRRAEAWLQARGVSVEVPRATGPHEPLGDYLLRWWTRTSPAWRSLTPRGNASRLKLAGPLATLPVGVLTHEHLQELFGALLRDHAPRTVAHLRMLLRQALEELVPEVLPVNPVRRTRLPRVPQRDDTRAKAWGSADASAFLAAAEGTRLYALWRLALGLGMRLGELRALRWEDLDLEAGTITVGRSANAGAFAAAVGEPKSRRPRTVELPRVVQAALKQHRAAQRHVTGWVFVNDRGTQPWSSGTIRDEFNAIRRASGAKPSRIHWLRHTAASLLLGARVPLPRVSQILGHANPSITLAVYGWALPDDARAGADAMDRLLP